MNPTDDELAKWHEDYFGCPPYDAETIPGMRAAIEAKTCTDAVCKLRARGWAGPKCEPLARALRSRFPQPITKSVLRAEGFKPDQGGWWAKYGEKRVEAWQPEGLPLRVCPTGSLDWFICRTPDRLHEVVECLKGLYGGGEG